MLVEENLRLLEQFLDAIWMEKGLSENTLLSYRYDLFKLLNWLSQENDINQTPLAFTELSVCDLQTYLYWLFDHQYKAATRARMLSAIKCFFQYLYREKLRSDDPSATLTAPKLGKRLPLCLTETQVDVLLDSPDLNDVIELRDKAMLELLYATGIRAGELIGLTTENVSLRQGVIRVIGKGRKERLVPMGETAVEWLDIYLKKSRPFLLGQKTSDTFFPSRRGVKMTRQAFWYRIKYYAKLADIDAELLSPHVLRHAFATHLLNNGAGIRVVQMLLGHSNLSTTQIYTHLACTRLKALHQKHHPRK